MATDVTRHYGTARGGEPLSDQQQTRLRELAAKAQWSPLEAYELGALKGQGKATQQGQQVLADVAHEEDAAQASRRRAQAQGRQPQRPPAKTRQQARMSDREYDRNYRMLGEHMGEGS